MVGAYWCTLAVAISAHSALARQHEAEKRALHPRIEDPLGAPATLGALGIPDDVVDDNRAAEMALQLRSKSDDVSAATASTPCRINSKVELDKYCDQLSTSDYTCSDYYTQDSQSDALRACFDNGSGTCQAALLDTADRSDARGALNKWCYQLSTSQYTCSDYYTINPHTGATKVCYDSGSSRCVAMPARFDACPQSPPSLPPPPPMPGTFMFGMSSTDALVFDMEASPRQLTKDRAEARANDIRAAIRRVRRKTRMSSPELPDFVEAFEVDLVDPAPQDATPEQQKMHDEKSLNLLQCPGGGSTDEDKVIALRAMARTAQAAAPGCYSTYTDGNQTEPRETEPASHARVLISETHQFVFLGLPSNQSKALEEWLSCQYNAKLVDHEMIENAAEGKYANFTHASVQNDPTVRALAKYAGAMDAIHNLLHASAAQGIRPDQSLGFPTLALEREVTLRSAWAGEGAFLSMLGSSEGFYSYVQDAARSNVIGCRGHWWAGEGLLTDAPPASLSSMWRRTHSPYEFFRSLLAGGVHAADPDAIFERVIFFLDEVRGVADFVFRAGHVFEDTENFARHLNLRNGGASSGDERTCLRPLSASAGRTPEPRTMALLANVVHERKIQRLVCALFWQELVCGDSLPEACAADAPLLSPHARAPPNATAFAWLAEAMEGLEGEPRNEDGVDGTDASESPDDLEEEALICSQLNDMDLHEEAKTVGIVTVDTRAFSSPIHPGVKMWRAYAAAHSHMYINLHPGGDLLSASPAEQDWVVSTRLLETLMSEAYAHIHHFMYTELDQWMVRPMLKLEQLFRTVGMYGCHGAIMAVKAIPSQDGEVAENIETGTFLYRRSPKLRKLLLAWTDASYGAPSGNTTSSVDVSRQYAFVHNPNVYATFKDHITVLSGVPFGLPYSPRIGHATHEDVVHRRISNGTYDADKARDVQQAIIQPCVLAALRTSTDRTCSLPPALTGGSCRTCTKQLSLLLPNGTEHRFEATQCCNEADASIFVQKYYELAAIFEAQQPQKIVDALVDVYEGRAPLAAYHARLHHVLPELASPVPADWLVGKPARQPLEPRLQHHLRKKYLNASVAPQSCAASGTCDAPEGCWEQMQAVSKLPTTEINQWHDYLHCLSPGSAGSASPINAYCTSEACSQLTWLMRSDTSPVDGVIGIVTIDSRSAHPAISAWRAYCAAHGYEYVHLISSATPEDLASVSDVNMLFDWRSNLKLLDLLKDENYRQVEYFLYTELDQWITTPSTMRLEPLFIAHGLSSKANVMAVLEEFPCRDDRRGGVFNMGTFLFRRGEQMEQLLLAWFNSKAHGGEHNASWPARQGAFSHDPLVYNAFKDRISVMRSACPLGSPFGLALGHVLGGSVVGVFDPEPGRMMFQSIILPCVQDALTTGIDRTCSLNPRWSGGNCLSCTQPMTLKRSDGTEYHFEATQCCGETDPAVPIAKFRELAGLFEASDPTRIAAALKDVYEGKAPMEAYALLGLDVLADGWRVDWRSAAPLKLDDEIDQKLAAEAAAMALAAQAPSPPPPTPPLCDTWANPAGCARWEWQGPERLVFVAASLTADTPMLDTLRHVHLQTGIPYAWGGEHAGWLEDAAARGLRCGGKLLRADPPFPADGDRTQGLCFLEYLVQTNQTSRGLWIWHDVMGMVVNRMLHQVMPDAVWFTTVREPFQHALASFHVFQFPVINQTVMQPDECEYSGPNFRQRMGLLCFINLFADPVLRHCREGEALLSSQLCSLGLDTRPTGAEVAANYTVLPAENYITPLLAALYLEWGVSLAVVQRIHASIQDECAHGGSLSVVPVASLAAAARLHQEAGVDAAALQRAQSEFTSSSSVEVGRLHEHAVAQAANMTQRYYAAMNYTSNHSSCWEKLFAPAATRAVAAMAAIPHTDYDRWAAFDNANYRFSHIRLDQCMAGLPHNIGMASHADSRAPAATAPQARSALGGWVRSAREHSPSCFNGTGYRPDLSGEHYGDALVAPKYNLAFHTTAAAAAAEWMVCRFDAEPGAASSRPEHSRARGTTKRASAQLASLPEYTRLVVVRDPAKRAIHAVFQMITHYLAVLRLPPAALRSCAAAWPDGLDNLANDHTIWDSNSSWPPACREAWTLDAVTKAVMPRSQMVQMTHEQLRATAKSSLLEALWKQLPNGCQQLGRTIHGEGTAWWCDEDDDDCTRECQVSEATMASLLGHALSDAAKQHLLGCESWMSGGERMRPQMIDLHRSGRADAVLRLESLAEDSLRFEKILAEKRGEPLPPASEGCSVAEILGDRDPTAEGFALLEPGLANTTMSESVLRRSPDLQRRLCALYYHDFVCGGYELLDACRGHPDQWLDAAVEDLLNDTPVTLE